MLATQELLATQEVLATHEVLATQEVLATHEVLATQELLTVVPYGPAAWISHLRKPYALHAECGFGN